MFLKVEYGQEGGSQMLREGLNLSCGLQEVEAGGRGQEPRFSGGPGTGSGSGRDREGNCSIRRGFSQFPRSKEQGLLPFQGGAQLDEPASGL